LIPALAGGALPNSRDWLVVWASPGAHPLVRLLDQVIAKTGADSTAATAVNDDQSQFVAFLVELVFDGKPRETTSSARIVLIVDQFEEIFTECQEEAERQIFIAALCAAAANPAVLVVLGVRADFYDRCLAYPTLLSALQDPVALGPMSA